MKINEEDIVEFIEDRIIITSSGEKLIKIMPFEWDDFLNDLRRKEKNK